MLGVFGVGGDLLRSGNRLTSAQGFAAPPVLSGCCSATSPSPSPTGALLPVIERKVAILR